MASNGKNIVYFDLETQKSFDEVGGRTPDHFRQLRISVGVSYSTRDDQYRIFHEGNAHELIKQLMSADLVVGHNIIHFDYLVLSAYSPLDLTQVPTLDTLVEIEKILKHRLSLDAIAKSTLGNTKIANGLDAIRWWREGGTENILKIAIKASLLSGKLLMSSHGKLKNSQIAIGLPVSKRVL